MACFHTLHLLLPIAYQGKGLFLVPYSCFIKKKKLHNAKKKSSIFYKKPAAVFKRSDLTYKCKSAGKKLKDNLTLQLQYIT